MYTTDKEHNKEIRKSYGDGYLDGFNDGRKIGYDGIKAKLYKFNYESALKCLEHYMCPMCENRKSTDDTCDECTLKLSNYTYDRDWL